MDPRGSGKIVKRWDLRHFWARLSEVTREDPLPLLVAHHLRLLRKLNSGPVRALAHGAPRIGSRYTRPYLSLALNTRQRRDIFEFHHEFVARTLCGSAISDVARGGLMLWSHSKDGLDCSIWLATDKSLYGEGDLSLRFYANQVEIYDLSFSFAPAGFFSEREPLSLLITRVQGRAGLFDTIRLATKACRDIQPPYLLLAAVEGLAAALGVDRARGICREKQLARRWSEAKFDYDAFWADQLGARSGDWFVGALPFARKPLEEVAAHHRRRAKRKRAFRDSLSTEVCKVMTPKLCVTSRPVSAPVRTLADIPADPGQRRLARRDLGNTDAWQAGT